MRQTCWSDEMDEGRQSSGLNKCHTYKHNHTEQDRNHTDFYTICSCSQLHCLNSLWLVFENVEEGEINWVKHRSGTDHKMCVIITLLSEFWKTCVNNHYKCGLFPSWCLSLVQHCQITPTQIHSNITIMSSPATLPPLHLSVKFTLTPLSSLSSFTAITKFPCWFSSYSPHVTLVVWPSSLCSVEEVQQPILLYCLEELYVSSCCLVERK